MQLLKNYVQGRVSVIIISYNYGQFICQAIDSVLDQGIKECEIIIIDDGSTDNTLEILKSYGNKVKYIKQENSGQSTARNNGLSHSTGEFIQFLDADDLLGPGKIFVQLDYFKNHPDAFIAVCPSYRFSDFKPDGKPNLKNPWHLFKKNLDVHACYTNIAPPHAFLFRREVVAVCDGFDSAVDNCEDYDLLLKAITAGYIPQYTPGGTVYYRKHNKSVTANKIRQYRTDALMHLKLSELMEKKADFPDRRLEGILAFSAGCLQTANRLYETDKDLSRSLTELANIKITSLKDLKNIKNNRPGFLFFLYYFKIKILLKSFPENNQVTAIKTNLLRLLRSLEIISFCSFTQRFLLTLFIKNEVTCRERLYLLKLALLQV